MGLTKDVAVVIFVVLALFIHFFPVLDELSIDGAPHMEADGTVLIIALDANSLVSLLTDCAEEMPP